METVYVLVKSPVICGFKSYYVVWKHWKKKNCREVDIRFKSYYVVWKPATSKSVLELLNSLNRTM